MSSSASNLQIAVGDGWRLSRIECCARASDRPFEEVHGAHLMAIVERGSFSYSGARGRALLHGGSVLTAHAGQCYCCAHNRDGGDTCLALQIDNVRFEEIAAFAAGSSRFVFPAAAYPLHGSLMAGAAQLATVRNAARLQDVVFEFATQLLCLSAGVSQDRPASLANTLRIETSLRHADARLGERLTLDELASCAGLSRFHYARLFKTIVGTSPYDHILKQRLFRAARLLADTRRPVLDISLDCGFGDLSTFNAAFRSHFGQTPGAFRRNSTS